MKITICIGSSCHLKGSRLVVERLQELVDKNGLTDKVNLCGAFCMKNCVSGVSVMIDDKLFSVNPDEAAVFFKNEVLGRVS